MKARSHHHRACCPFHALMLWPGGMGAGRDTPASAGEPPSFSDATPAEASPAAYENDTHTRDLYEVADRDRLVVIRGATVLPMTNGGSLSEHDVIVRNGAIVDVLPSAGNRPPDDAVLIEAAGKYVIPGLTEIHTHPILAHSAAMFAPAISPEAKGDALYLPYDLQMFLYVAAGVTRIEIMAGTAEELAMRESIRGGRYRGPAMRIASPVIDGYPPMQPPAISLIATDAEGGRRAAQWIAERGFDFAKPYTRINREAYTAFAEECRSLGIMMMGHVPKAVGVEDAIALGQRGVAHVFEFFDWEQEPTRSDPEVMARRARLCAEHGVAVQTTICAASMFEYDSGFTPDEPLVHQSINPVLNYLMHERSPFIQAWRNDPVMVEAGRDILKLSIQMTQALVAEGVAVLPGTDVPGSNVTDGYNLHEELRYFVEDVGMTPMEALRAATVTCAEYQGEGAVAGTLERGKRSDLVILDADPLAAIGATKSIYAVMIGNALLSRDALDRGLARAKERYAAMPVPKEPPPLPAD